MSIKNVEKAVLSVFCCAVLLTSLVTTATILNPAPLKKDSESSDRSPASIFTLTATNTIKAVNTLATVKFKCKNDQQENLEATTNQFKIKGKHCPNADEQFSFTTITNKTNSHQATVFELKTHFTSDYIQLEDGNNTIEVVEHAKNGLSKTTTINIYKSTTIASADQQ